MMPYLPEGWPDEVHTPVQTTMSSAGPDRVSVMAIGETHIDLGAAAVDEPLAIKVMAEGFQMLEDS